MLIYIILEKPAWFRNLVTDIYNSWYELRKIETYDGGPSSHLKNGYGSFYRVIEYDHHIFIFYMPNKVSV